MGHFAVELGKGRLVRGSRPKERALNSGPSDVVSFPLRVYIDLSATMPSKVSAYRCDMLPVVHARKRYRISSIIAPLPGTCRSISILAVTSTEASVNFVG
jgi:hypothetical protein